MRGEVQAEIAELSNAMQRKVVDPGGLVMDGVNTNLGLCLMESGKVGCFLRKMPLPYEQDSVCDTRCNDLYVFRHYINYVCMYVYCICMCMECTLGYMLSV